MAEVKKKATAVVPEESVEETAPKAEPKKAEKAAVKDADKASFYMYLGPGIVGKIQHASIWPGDFEKVCADLADVIGKYPRVKALLISDKALVEDRINVTKPGTRLYAEYHRLANELKK